MVRVCDVRLACLARRLHSSHGSLLLLGHGERSIGRDGEVRYLGEIDNSPDAVKKLVAKLSRQYERLHFCYEAGPTGYGLHRQLTDLGHICDVVAPTMIPKRSGDRVKTNRRDSVTLVKLLRAGELRAIARSRLSKIQLTAEHRARR